MNTATNAVQMNTLEIGETFHFPKGKRSYEVTGNHIDGLVEYVNPNKDGSFYECKDTHMVLVGDVKANKITVLVRLNTGLAFN